MHYKNKILKVITDLNIIVLFTKNKLNGKFNIISCFLYFYIKTIEKI